MRFAKQVGLVAPILTALGVGCGAPASVVTEPALVSESAGASGAMTDVLLEMTVACASACRLEDTCLGAASATTVGVSCLDACAARYRADRWADSPTSRICLAAEQRELECFTGLSCDAVQTYFLAYASTANPCAAEDSAAVDACAGLDD